MPPERPRSSRAPGPDAAPLVPNEQLIALQIRSVASDVLNRTDSGAPRPEIAQELRELLERDRDQQRRDALASAYRPIRDILSAVRRSQDSRAPRDAIYELREVVLDAGDTILCRFTPEELDELEKAVRRFLQGAEDFIPAWQDRRARPRGPWDWIGVTLRH